MSPAPHAHACNNMLVSSKAFKAVRTARTRGHVACGATKRDVLLTSAAVTAFGPQGKWVKADETEQQDGNKEQQDADKGTKSQESAKALATSDKKAEDAGPQQAQGQAEPSSTTAKDAGASLQGRSDNKSEQTSSKSDAQSSKSTSDLSAKPEGQAAENISQPKAQSDAASKAAPAKAETKAEEKLQETATAGAEQKAADKAEAPAAQKPSAPKGADDKAASAKAADDKAAAAKAADDKAASAKAADDKAAAAKAADAKAASAKAADDKAAAAKKETKAEQKIQETAAADAKQKAKDKPAPQASQKPAKPWKDQDQRRMLHPVMIVADLDKQQNFYSNVLGMKALRSRSFRDGYDNGFSGFLPESTGTALEMTVRSAPRKLDIGSGFRHYTVAVSSIRDTVRKAKLLGYKAYEGENVDERHQFVRDPSGYPWELVFRPDSVKEPFREISLLVSDIEKSKKFYSQGLGMRVTMSKSSDKFSQVHLCWGDESSNTVLELTQPLTGPDANKPVERSKEGYLSLAVGTNDVYKTAEEVRSAGGKVLQEPNAIGGIGTQVTKVADPDGWILAFIDNNDFLAELRKAR